MQKPFPHIPLIILNWNGLEDTKMCIDSVLQMEYPDFRIHLVDNCSDHNEGQFLKDLYQTEKRVTVWLQNENMGFVMPHNQLFRQFISEGYTYVALLNNDTAVEPEWLTHLVGTAIEKGGDVISSRMIHFYDRTKLDNAGHKMLNTGEIVPVGYNEPVEKFDRPFENLGASAGACLYSLKMIEKIGGFDEFFRTGYEDAEFGIRAYLTGHKCLFEPGAIVYHKRGQSIRKVFDEKYARRIQQNIWYSYCKLMPATVILLSTPFILIRFLMLSLLQITLWKPKHLRILWGSLYEILTGHRKKLQNARFQFHKNHKTLPFYKILFDQEFFLWFDVKRFYQFIILGKKSALDQYG